MIVTCLRRNRLKSLAGLSRDKDICLVDCENIHYGLKWMPKLQLSSHVCDTLIYPV
jgi:hypothetical protein